MDTEVEVYESHWEQRTEDFHRWFWRFAQMDLDADPAEENARVVDPTPEELEALANFNVVPLVPCFFLRATPNEDGVFLCAYDERWLGKLFSAVAVSNALQYPVEQIERVCEDGFLEGGVKVGDRWCVEIRHVAEPEIRKSHLNLVHLMARGIKRAVEEELKQKSAGTVPPAA